MVGVVILEIGWMFDDFDVIVVDVMKDGKYGFGMGMGGY